MNPIYYNNNTQRPPLYGNPVSQNQLPPQQAGNIYGPSQPPSIFSNPQFINKVSNYITNNYANPNVYQPNNYPPSNTQVPLSSSLISGKIGRILIAQENQENFLKSLKSTEWTQNPIYLQAKGIQVSPTFVSNQQGRERDRKIPRPCFDQYSLDVSIMNDFNNYKKEIEERKQKINEEVQKEKEDFVKYNFPNENKELSLQEIYYKIGSNKGGILIRDNNVYTQVEKYIPFLKQTSSYQGREEEAKIYTNDGRGGTATPPPGMMGY